MENKEDELTEEQKEFIRTSPLFSMTQDEFIKNFFKDNGDGTCTFVPPEEKK